MNNMQDNVERITRFLAAFQSLDHRTMADCYCPDAAFEDIAFQVGGDDIGIMWRMICEKGIEVVIDEPPRIEGHRVVAKITDTYLFGDPPGRKVVNPITCYFTFRDGLIETHIDECDPIHWADQAIGGFQGWLAGRVGFLRRRKARKKIEAFKQKIGLR